MPNDVYRTTAIRMGYVPPTCLHANGEALLILVSMGADPCRTCPIDRTLCHGRPHERTT